MTLFDAVMEVNDTDLSAQIKNKVGVFRDLIGELKADKQSMSLVDFVGEMVMKIGFEKYYRSTGKEEDENRWANIEEFLTYIDENYKDEDVSLDDFLQGLALNTDADNDDDDFDSVVIATMHAAKGLEFKVVFIIACEEGIIPSSQSLRETNGVEEERRVMYVALTRAQERLYVSAVRGVRRKYNRVESVLPSRFFAETKGESPQQIVQKMENYPGFGKFTDEYESAIPSQIDYTAKVTPIKPAVIQQKPKVYNTSSAGYKAGAKVEHKKYGIGTVIAVTGEGNAVTVSVVFPGLGVKKFALMNAPLRLL